MVTKISTVAILFIIYVATVFSTCKKPKDCSGNSYSFEIGARAHPDLDSVNIGDTVYLQINSGTRLKDQITGNMIDYSNAGNLSTNIGFQQYLNGNFIDAVNKFNFTLLDGIEVASTVPSKFKEYKFSEVNGKYTLKLGLVPKTSGIFSIVFGNAANVYRINDQCSKASFVINFDSTNQHRYLIPGFFGPPPKGGDYYFKVK